MTTLRNRLFVPSALLAVVVGVTVLVLAWQAALQARLLGRELDQIRSTNALVFALTDAADAEQRWVLSYHLRPEAPLAVRISTEAERIGSLVDEIGALPLRPRAAALWGDYVGARVLLLQARDELLAATAADDPAGVSIAFDKWNLATDRANALLASFASFHVRRLERAVSDSQHQRANALYTAAAALAAGVLLAIGFSVLLARSLVRPIVAMAATAEQIADQGLAVPVKGADRADELGTLARAFNRMTDQLVTTNARLGEAVRARDEFISIASHELKTPLTPLKLQLQVLLRTVRRAGSADASPERILHAMRNFERLVTRVGLLVENMLDVSRITSGRLRLHTEDLAVDQLLHEAAQRLEHPLLDAGATLRVETGHAGTVRADRLRLDQVIDNLVGNALRYAPGPIVLRSRADGDAVVIEVEDRGPGIPAADHQRIFARFERAVGEHRHTAGLGLGLYIAREIVRAHGGELTVESEVGRGATFRITLPPGPAAASTAPALVSAPPRAGSPAA